MAGGNEARDLNQCPSCGKRVSYLTKRCASCNHQYSPAELLRIAAGVLRTGVPVKTLRRQVGEAIRGHDDEARREIPAMAAHEDESMVVLAIVAAEMAGDVGLVPPGVLEKRFRGGGRTLRMEAARALAAMRTEEARRAIERLRPGETDEAVLRAFEGGGADVSGPHPQPVEATAGGRRTESTYRETFSEGGGADLAERVSAAPHAKVLPAAGLKFRDDEVAAALDALRPEGGGGGTGGEGEALPVDIVQEVPIEAGGGEGIDAAAAGARLVEDDEMMRGGSDAGEREEPTGTVPPPLPVPEQADASSRPPGSLPGPTPVAPPRPTTSLLRGSPAEKRTRSLLVFFLATVAIVLAGAFIAYAFMRWGLEPVATVNPPPAAGQAPAGGTGAKAAGPAAPVSHILGGAASASSAAEKSPAANVTDGNPATVWMEAAGRSPAGEWLKVELAGGVTVTRVGLAGGYDFIDAGGKDFFPLHDRLKEVELLFPDGAAQRLRLEDTRSTQYFDVKPPRAAAWIRITIFDTYAGSANRDCAVGEVEAWGYEENGEHAEGAGAQ